MALKSDINTAPWIVLRHENNKETTKKIRAFDPVYKNNGTEKMPIQASVGLDYSSLGKPRRSIKLGKDAIATTILGLQSFIGKSNKDYGIHLTVSIEAISEAIRFRYVLDFIVSHFEKGEVPGELLEEITLNWSNMGKYLIKLYNQIKGYPPIPVKFNYEDANLTTKEILQYVVVIKDYEESTGNALKIPTTKKWRRAVKK
ncbi:hypothetical protein POM88_019002 [Heracleum sosnowskyi]|uniref:rRNA N-glycosylase n=1 Tax=Heracleum sosnowskyi TaxID=360622 RepID=A0AAD8ITF9_9APIA|nr:hypothetical protein POM88_019002 [Heracleum sosnowskyi]